MSTLLKCSMITITEQATANVVIIMKYVRYMAEMRRNHFCIITILRKHFGPLSEQYFLFQVGVITFFTSCQPDYVRTVVVFLFLSIPIRHFEKSSPNAHVTRNSEAGCLIFPEHNGFLFYFLCIAHEPNAYGK